MAKTDRKFSSQAQLKQIIERYPEDPVDIQGVILDYVGRTGVNLLDVLRLNHRIYEQMFMDDNLADGRRLIRSLVSSPQDAKELARRCRQIFPNIGMLADEMSSAPNGYQGDSPQVDELLSDPQASLGRPVRCVVWQLSDLHFGRFNKFEQNPKELASQLAKAAVETQNLRPDIVVISGDATSTAAETEFDDFCIFCETLSTVLWQGAHPERILAVPGNHDVTWEEGGQADRMAGFDAHLASRGVCVTPFRSDMVPLDAGVSIVWHDGEADEVPPLARVTYDRYGLEFILLVSGYYSGEVPEQIRELIHKADPTLEILTELLRVDEGAVNRRYLLNIAQMPSAVVGLRIAVTHHNPIQYGPELCLNKLAPQLLETLYLNKMPVLLHGHIHLVEGGASVHPVVAEQAYPMPCTTLCGDCGAGDRGFSVHLIGGDVDQMAIDSLQWDVSTSQGFKKEGLRFRYRILIGPDGLTMR